MIICKAINSVNTEKLDILYTIHYTFQFSRGRLYHFSNELYENMRLSSIHRINPSQKQFPTARVHKRKRGSEGFLKAWEVLKKEALHPKCPKPQLACQK